MDAQRLAIIMAKKFIVEMKDGEKPMKFAFLQEEAI